MKKPEFTNEELSFMNVLCVKADPMGVVTQAQSIRKKINDYALAQQKQDLENQKKAVKKNKKVKSKKKKNA